VILNQLLLLNTVRAQFPLDYLGIHGAPHWSRVMDNGLILAQRNGADVDVIRLFAFLHDSCREDENADPLHGMRAAAFTSSIRNRGIFQLSEDRFERLHFAIGAHCDGLTEADITVQTCWDADRLDLGRVGVRPDPRRLCTANAKNPDVIKEAYWRSMR